MDLKKQIYPAVALTVVLTVLLGFIYPAFVTLVAQVIFPEEARGSLITKDGVIIGSRLMGQPFSGDGYFHSRPSAAGVGYDGMSSAGTNFGSTNKKLIEEKIKPEVEKVRQWNQATIPGDLVTSSASGLDPHISPAAAEFQADRVAKARGLSPSEIRDFIKKHIEKRQLGFLGEPRVNVLELNLALDAAHPVKSK
jgi:K+-transporting ATPase ATPase C chain